MARIIVMADAAVGSARSESRTTGNTRGRTPETPVLLDERVSSIHLCDEHAAEQLIERLAWAVGDAEAAEAAARPARAL